MEIIQAYPKSAFPAIWRITMRQRIRNTPLPAFQRNARPATTPIPGKTPLLIMIASISLFTAVRTKGGGTLARIVIPTLQTTAHSLA